MNKIMVHFFHSAIRSLDQVLSAPECKVRNGINANDRVLNFILFNNMEEIGIITSAEDRIIKVDF